MPRVPGTSVTVCQGPFSTGSFSLLRHLVVLSATPTKPGTWRHTVRLHFAEPDDVKPGERVFDVKLQGNVVLRDFDVVREAAAAAPW